MPPATQHNTVTIYTESQKPQFQICKKLLEQFIGRKMLKMKDEFKKSNASMLNQYGEIEEHTHHTALYNIIRRATYILHTAH